MNYSEQNRENRMIDLVLEMEEKGYDFTSLDKDNSIKLNERTRVELSFNTMHEVYEVYLIDTDEKYFKRFFAETKQDVFRIFHKLEVMTVREMDKKIKNN